MLASGPSFLKRPQKISCWQVRQHAGHPGEFGVIPSFELRRSWCETPAACPRSLSINSAHASLGCMTALCVLSLERDDLVPCLQRCIFTTLTRLVINLEYLPSTVIDPMAGLGKPCPNFIVRNHLLVHAPCPPTSSFAGMT